MNSEKKHEYFSKMPAGISGLGLGIAGLGIAISTELNSSYNKYIFNTNQTQAHDLEIAGYVVQGIMAFLATICFVLILLKIIFSFKTLMKELKDPLISSFLPTESMCLASIAYFIGVMSIYGHSPSEKVVNAGTVIANILMLLSIFTHFAFLTGFFIHVIMKHSIKNDVIYSSWLVPLCGIWLSCAFEPKLGHLVPNEFYQFIWYFAFFNLVLFIPYMIFKHLFFPTLDSDKLPSMAIFFAAPNLVLNGMLSLFPEVDYYSPMFIAIVAVIILIFALFGVFIYYITLIRCSKVKFNPSFAAFTFPIAVSSIATIKLTDYIYLTNTNYKNNFSPVLTTDTPFVEALQIVVGVVGFIYLITAIFVISYVALRYIPVFKRLVLNLKIFKNN